MEFYTSLRNMNWLGLQITVFDINRDEDLDLAILAALLKGLTFELGTGLTFEHLNILPFELDHSNICTQSRK